MEQETQVNNNDTESKLSAKCDEKQSANQDKSKGRLLYRLFVLLFLSIIPIILCFILSIRYLMNKDDTIKMNIPGEMDLTFTYPRIFSSGNAQKTKLNIVFTNETLNGKVKSIEIQPLPNGIIGLVDKDGYRCEHITLNSPQRGWSDKKMEVENTRGWNCKFQLKVQTKGESEGKSRVAYSEVHSIILLPYMDVNLLFNWS